MRPFNVLDVPAANAARKRRSNKMKKLIMMMASVVAAMPLIADEWYDLSTGYTWSYRILSNGDGVEIFKQGYTTAVFPSPTGKIVIPSTLGGLPVTSIGDGAMRECMEMTDVTIPNGVTAISAYAFSECGIKSITIPDSVEGLGRHAFGYCCNLTNAVIGSGVSHIGQGAFVGCSELAHVTIGNNVTSIGDGAFYDCHESLYDTTTISGVSLVDGWIVDVPTALSDTLTSLDLTGAHGVCDYAFAFYANLRSVTIPDSVKHIGQGAFVGCSSSLFDTRTILGVELVDGWAVGHTDTISGDLHLTGVRGIADYTFQDCQNLTSVLIPDSVASIGDGAFCECTNMTNVVFNGNAPIIVDGAFSSVNPDCIVYVSRCSTGWGVEIPGTWNGLRIEYLEEEPQTHTVTFNLGDHGIRIGGGELTQTVTNDCAAIAPEITATDGWAFTGWSATFTNVTANLTVTAQYERLSERVDYYVYGGGSALQRVIDIAANGSTILVGDGTYSPIDTANKTLTIRSVNGADRTFISGSGGRCALLGVIMDNGDPCSVFDLYVESFGTTLEGFTLKNGSCRLSYDIHDAQDAFGGGVAGGVLRDCKIVGCTAYLGGGVFQSSLIRCEIRSCWADSYDDFYFEPKHVGMGGGAYDCVLDNCLIHLCSADGDVGGAIYCDVFSCTIAENDLSSGGSVSVGELETGYTGGVSAGINFCNVSNSIVWGNVEYVAVYDENWNPVLDEYGYVQIRERWNDCYFIGENGGERKGFFVGNCIYSIPSNWLSSSAPVIQNNITNDPQFVDAEHGDYHLKQTSPCIDAAGWAATNAVMDLDGKPRVSGIAPDIGAYEYQYVASPIPELAPSATPADVATALSGSADDGLVANVTNAAQYAAYREWALAVKDVEGVSIAGAQTVKDSSRAWLSFALGTERLVPDVLTSDDIKIESFELTAEDGKFAFEVSIADVGIGEGVTITDANRDAIIGNIKKALGVEGATRLNESEFSSDNIEVTFDTPVDGKARFTAKPPANVGNSFFMRVKVK